MLWDLGLAFDWSYCLFLWFSGLLDFLDVVGILYKHVRSYQFHQISFLCEHHDLACTLKDPPRRVDMNEMSFRNVYRTNYWVIDETVSKPTIVTPHRFADFLMLLL